MLMLLFACGGAPTATAEVAPVDGVSTPKALDGALDRQVRRPIQECYVKAAGQQDGLSGTVTAVAKGSHGILKSELTGEPPEALGACVLETLGDQRLMRSLADGDRMVGFQLTVTFTEG